ncbi:hypothetical protein C8F04DRAFT_1191678 [Mycena alexandri]|uniref:Uncharacterized protein n=1 Tax=Mycena alexandri TaxID=1745969 RepID=A0AAD6SCL2_9AGAR|nr:hypothetical protein C8F04DRAFT_1191678 [Mycena alexandri]
MSELKTPQAFPDVLALPDHDPFFSMENAPSWITSHGLQLYLMYDDSVTPDSPWTADNASATQLKAYRGYILSDQYLGHPYFSSESPELRVKPKPFEAYMSMMYGSFEDYQGRRQDSTPFSSRAPSRVASSVAGSRASSRGSFIPSSRASSPISFIYDVMSRPPSAMSDHDFMETPQSDHDSEFPNPDNLPASEELLAPPVPDDQPAPNEGVGKGKAKRRAKAVGEFKITHQRIRIHGKALVDIRLVTQTPSVFSPMISTNRSSAAAVLSNVVVLIPFRLREFEPDLEGMQDLWRHELDFNEQEAESVVGIIARFYTRIMNSTCRVKCAGCPYLFPYSGQTHFVGCSNWSRNQKGKHLYFAILQNVNTNDLRFAMEHHGLLPPTHQNSNKNKTCVLTVHPRVSLKNCHTYDDPIRHSSHICGASERRDCPTRMLIFILVVDTHATRNKAIVVLRNPHNHPMHPKIKPSGEDRIKLGVAVQAVGLTGLTGMKLLNAPSTSMVYNGSRVAEHSPAFVSARKVRDFISAKKIT